MNEQFQTGELLDTSDPITVTVVNERTGERVQRTVRDDYVLVCAGKRYVAHVNEYPMAGTTVLTVKTSKDGDGE